MGLGWKASGGRTLDNQDTWLSLLLCLCVPRQEAKSVYSPSSSILLDLCAHASLFSYITIFFNKEGLLICTFYWLAVHNSINM